MKNVLVKKFGGTSVGSIERIEKVADRLAESFNNGERFVVVSSAMSGETNRLVQLAHDVNPKSRGGEAYDLLLASGEQVSISLLVLALQKRGMQAAPMLAFQLGIKTDSIYSKARIQNIETDELNQMLESGIIPVVAGFQGIDENRKITTLGRGGSDTTAVALAAALKASACEIFTDVDGVYSTDPRVEPKASKINQLNYEEMMEMASLGSKVLHFRCVEIAAKYDIPIHVRSTFVPDEGTWISKRKNPMEAPVVSAITHDPRITILSAEPAPEGVEFLADLFTKLSEEEVLVDIISQAQGAKGQRVAFSIADEDAPQGVEILKSLFSEGSEIKEIPNVAKVSIVGVGMKTHPGVAARFFKAFKEAGIDLKLVTTSDIKMSGVLPREQVDLAVQSLHAEFGLSK
ncbi:MAG: aspartate kinase [Bdellovibrionales bacterium]